MENIIIKNERVNKIIRNRHPWIFSGAVKNKILETKPGTLVTVTDENNNFIGTAVYNPLSDISLRILTWDEKETINKNWFQEKIKEHAKKKEEFLGISNLKSEHKNYRLIYAECDNLPGLIIDRYGNIFVLQLHTAFADNFRNTWVDILLKEFKPSAIYEKSNLPVREKEGLSTMPEQILQGNLPENLIINEDNFKIFVDIPAGQKTGYFLDLRQVRRKLEYWCRKLNIEYLFNYFAYTGSFNLYACRAGVQKVSHIESSPNANKIAEENSKINNYKDKIDIISEDALKHLSSLKDNTIQAIIIDPPSFIKNIKDMENGIDGYIRLNNLAMRKLKKGGLLFSICCCSFIDEMTYQTILFKASALNKINIKVIEKTGHDVDHAWPLNFPEGRYLQSWILTKI